MILSILAVSAAYVGVWAAAAPRSFYASFPGGGRDWVVVDGPYNEHLVRDVGGLHLALLVLSVGALAADRATVRLVGLAWLVFSVPHLAYHFVHLGAFGLADQILNVVFLGGTVVLAALLVLSPRRAVVTSEA